MSASAGNLVDKYALGGPAGALVARWRAAVLELVALAAPRTLLDVGCGEGELTAEWANALPATRVLGADVADVVTARPRPNLAFEVIEPAPPLPHGDGAFDLVCAVESLEHMDDPEGALAEMARCARRHVLVSVPREPMWRALNVARGAHLTRLGNTPGHLGHFSARGLRRLLRGHGRVVDFRTPLPWSVGLLEV